MARVASRESHVRLNLKLSERTRERLDRVRELSEADSLTEVIRRALEVYDTLLTEVRKNGGTLVLKKSDGAESQIYII